VSIGLVLLAMTMVVTLIGTWLMRPRESHA
jgi:hypothetical protein